jgi:hypothetical protein
VVTEKRWHTWRQQFAFPALFTYLYQVKQYNQILKTFGLSPLLLENSLPLSGNTSARANVLLQGVDPCFHNVPLHHINLKSDFVSRQVIAGVRPTLPVEDISLLIGIDIAGDKAIKVPLISEEPSY